MTALLKRVNKLPRPGPRVKLLARVTLAIGVGVLVGGGMEDLYLDMGALDSQASMMAAADGMDAAAAVLDMTEPGSSSQGSGGRTQTQPATTQVPTATAKPLGPAGDQSYGEDTIGKPQPSALSQPGQATAPGAPPSSSSPALGKSPLISIAIHLNPSIPVFE